MMLLKKTIQYLPAQLIAPAAQLAALLFWAHLLPPEKVAVITMMIAIQDGAYILFFQWWSHFVLRNGEASNIRKRIIAESEKFALLFCSVPLTVFVGIFTYYYLPHESFATPYIGVGFVLTRALANYRAERARAAGRVRVYSTVQIGGSLVGLVVALLAVNYWPYVDSVLLVFTLINLLLYLTARIEVAKKTASVFRFKALIIKSLQYGAAAAFATICTFAVMNFQRFAAQGLWDFATAGIFSVGFGIGTRIISVAVMMVSAAGFPLVIRRLHLEGATGAIDQISKNGLLLIYLLIPALLVSYYLTPSLVKLMLPTHYQEMANQILPLAALLAAIRYMRSHSIDQIFLAFDRTVHLAWLGLFEFTAAVISVLVFYKLDYGIESLLIGPIIVCLFVNLACLVWAVKSYSMSIRFGDVLGLVGSSACANIAYRISVFDDSLSAALVACTIALICYGAASVIFCPTLRKQVRRLV